MMEDPSNNKILHAVRSKVCRSTITLVKVFKIDIIRVQPVFIDWILK